MRETALRHALRCLGGRVASLIRADRSTSERLEKVEVRLGLTRPRTSQSFEPYDDVEQLEEELLGVEERT